MGAQVPCQLHGVVQHPTDHNHAGLQTVDKRVAWLADDPPTGFHVLSAQPQLPRPSARTEFGPRKTARSGGLTG